MSKVVCMIPARSGSKRIPHKNIKSFLGKPIITYPIETAKASGIFDDIFVYTDIQYDIISKIIPEGIRVIGRESTDTETLTEATLKFLQWYSDIDYLCVLLPTAVFVDSNNVALSYGFLNNKDIDSIITFCKYSHPIQRAFAYDNDKKLRMIYPQYMFTRTQDIKENYYDAGQMYFLNVKSFLKQKKIFMDNIYPIIIDAVDIDNPEDWEKAESYYKALREV